MGIIRRYAVWAVFGIAALAFLWSQLAPREEVVVLPCTDIVAGCALGEAGTRIRLDRQPDALKPFLVIVTWPGAKEVHASFQMEGMQMGFNRYTLVAQGGGEWRTETMLPACIQGRKDWRLELDVDGARYAVPFSSR